jgi:hypothetical protein
MTYRMILIAAGFLTSFTAVPAFALQGDGTSIGAIRQELRDEAAPIKRVSIEGNLSCMRGSLNTGQACELKLSETKTGRIYNLTQTKSAMELFENGKKQVLIEGHMTDADTLEIRNAQTL